MFIDHARIYIKAGNGGNGCLAFRREKFTPKGGPSGGTGGKGGDIYFHSTTHLNTLLPFRYQQHFRARSGNHGSGNKRSGKDGKPITVEVPVGTEVYEEASGELLFDLDRPDRLELAAQGGKGGRGNAEFATSTNQAPRKFERGQPGQERTLVLELKILADVGLIGYPNAGKSTLVAAISSARPKIADYPFTTLNPTLGVVSYGNYGSFVVADIPGLIEGAHRGAGLGDQFLRHIERTRLLVHLIDVTDAGQESPLRALKAIDRELERYSPSLLEKPQIVTASKVDSANVKKLSRLSDYCRQHRLIFCQISAVTGEGVKELRDTIIERLRVAGN